MVIVDTSRRASAYSAEFIEVELTAEGFVLRLVEIEGQNSSDKLVGVVNFECGAALDPRDFKDRTSANGCKPSH